MKTDKIQRVKLESDEDNIHIDCPNCDNWEQLGVDDPRKRLNALPITQWLTDDEVTGNEVSAHECIICKTVFEVEWDYENPITVGAI